MFSSSKYVNFRSRNQAPDLEASDTCDIGAGY